MKTLQTTHNCLSALPAICGPAARIVDLGSIPFFGGMHALAQQCVWAKQDIQGAAKSAHLSDQTTFKSRVGAIGRATGAVLRRLPLAAVRVVAGVAAYLAGFAVGFPVASAGLGLCLVSVAVPVALAGTAEGVHQGVRAASWLTQGSPDVLPDRIAAWYHRGDWNGHTIDTGGSPAVEVAEPAAAPRASELQPMTEERSPGLTPLDGEAMRRRQAAMDYQPVVLDGVESLGSPEAGVAGPER